MAHVAMPAASSAITPSISTDALFTDTYRDYSSYIHGFILGRLGNRDTYLADDLTQETFFKLYRLRDRVDMTTHMGGILRTMARQIIADHFKVKRNTQERTTDTGTWQYANRDLEPATGGYYTPAATGFRTAHLGGGR